MTRFREVKKDETFPGRSRSACSRCGIRTKFESRSTAVKIRRRSLLPGLRSRPAFRTTGICSRGLSGYRSCALLRTMKGYRVSAPFRLGLSRPSDREPDPDGSEARRASPESGAYGEDKVQRGLPRLGAQETYGRNGRRRCTPHGAFGWISITALQDDGRELPWSPVVGVQTVLGKGLILSGLPHSAVTARHGDSAPATPEIEPGYKDRQDPSLTLIFHARVGELGEFTSRRTF